MVSWPIVKMEIDAVPGAAVMADDDGSAVAVRFRAEIGCEDGSSKTSCESGVGVRNGLGVAT
jgi:hypothetical protein